jgi:hypothetical protein
MEKPSKGKYVAEQNRPDRPFGVSKGLEDNAYRVCKRHDPSVPIVEMLLTRFKKKDYDLYFWNECERVGRFWLGPLLSG